MRVKVISSIPERVQSDALLLPFFEGKHAAFETSGLTHLYERPLMSGDFSGKKGEILCHYPDKGKEDRLILLGIGKEKELTLETLRRAYGQAAQLLKGKAKAVTIVVPDSTILKDPTIGVAEGIFLGSYVYEEHLTEKTKVPTQFVFIGADQNALKRCETISKSVYFARDLVVGNADDVTPSFLAQMAKELDNKHANVTTTILDRKAIQKEGLHLLDAVSRSSDEEPRLIVVEYRGAPTSKKIYGLVGKGITYDTGGLNLKPTGGMEEMRDDMGGGAAVLGTMHAIAALKLSLNVVMVIASTENAIGPKSYKPGDVYHSHAGITVEVTNTDAEGRLVLADALSYIQEKYDPEQIIDIATLTGGVGIALGEEVIGLMANDDELAQKLYEAGETTFERVWRLPLYEEYKELLKSKFADIKNSGARKASSIQGGIFLERFIKKAKWAHLDIGCTAFPESRKSYQPVQATGIGVRLLTTFLETLCKKK